MIIVTVKNARRGRPPVAEKRLSCGLVVQVPQAVADAVRGAALAARMRQRDFAGLLVARGLRSWKESLIKPKKGLNRK